MRQTELHSLFQSLADPTRLRILNLLLKGELCVGDIVKILSLPQPTVSRHLGYLEKRHWVKKRKTGLWNFYSLHPATRKGTQRKLLNCLRSFFNAEKRMKEDRTKIQKCRKFESCCP